MQYKNRAMPGLPPCGHQAAGSAQGGKVDGAHARQRQIVDNDVPNLVSERRVPARGPPIADRRRADRVAPPAGFGPGAVLVEEEGLWPAVAAERVRPWHARRIQGSAQHSDGSGRTVRQRTTACWTVFWLGSPA